MMHAGPEQSRRVARQPRRLGSARRGRSARTRCQTIERRRGRPDQHAERWMLQPRRQQRGRGSEEAEGEERVAARESCSCRARGSRRTRLGRARWKACFRVALRTPAPHNDRSRSRTPSPPAVPGEGDREDDAHRHEHRGSAQRAQRHHRARQAGRGNGVGGGPEAQIEGERIALEHLIGQPLEQDEREGSDAESHETGDAEQCGGGGLRWCIRRPRAACGRRTSHERRRPRLGEPPAPLPLTGGRYVDSRCPRRESNSHGVAPGGF